MNLLWIYGECHLCVALEVLQMRKMKTCTSDRRLHGAVLSAETRTHFDRHRQNVLTVTLHHNCELFWVRHTKGTHTSWQAVYSPEIRPPWPCQYLFRCCDCSRVSLGVGFTLPVRELEEMGERPRSARGIHLRSTSLLTVLNLVIKSDAKPVVFYENWQDMLQSAMWFLICPQSFEEENLLAKEMKEDVWWWKSENHRSDSLKDLQSDGGNMGDIYLW